MKKNITINLLGRLYAIDEDAYELLKQYTDSLHSYFGRREGGEEIADDIEARIAELFEELKAQGLQAITIEHVQDIIHRVGRPEEMESPLQDPSRPPLEGDEKASPFKGEVGEGLPPSREGRGGSSSRRLYRNMSDRKFMGVLSGLAAYFGGDVLWWRLGYVALFFLPGGFVSRMFYWSHWPWGININVTLLLLYIALGVLMPVADTPEDRLRMKGKPVTPQNLADEVSKPQPQPGGDGHTGCLGGFFFIMGTLVRWFIYFVGIALAFTLLAAIVGLIAVMTMPHSMIHESDPTFWQFFDGNQTHLIAAAVLSLIVLAIPAYCIIHSLFSEIKMLQPMSFRQRLSFLIVWIGLFIAAAVVGTRLVGKAKEAEAMSHRIRIHDEQYRKDNTHDGIFYRPDEWEFLSERGWRVVRADHCGDRYTSRGQYYTGGNARYIDTYDARHRQLFTIERTDSLQPGRYRLSACVRASGQGAYVYAFIGGHADAPWYKEIPADGNTGGGLWREARHKRDSIDAYVTVNPDALRPSDYDFLRAIAETNNAQGYGWNRITLPVIVLKEPSLLHYGVSTDPSLTGSTWLGRWFSACDFELKRMEEVQSVRRR